jgi:diguanylate cyclase (GGDEF)-like protein|tara:strand:- start:1993 stop:2925 length:933 start_codon:yes stop_codon:yes gene_type:complete
MTSANVEDITEFRLKGDQRSTTDKVDRTPCLVVIDGDFIGEVFPLKKDLITIGRSDEVEITISDASVSRRHTQISQQRLTFFAEDLESTNGSKVNDKPIHAATELHAGDKLTVGDISFKFTYHDVDDTEYHRQLRNMAIRDGLTRIHNRRYFMEMAEKEFSYARRNKRNLTVILFDIDYFKVFNDTHGHVAGDFVLRDLAATLEHTVREYDVFARYGGEEFVFLLRGSPLAPAVNIADRVRRTVAEKVFIYEEQNLEVTISVGVATYIGDTSLSTLVELIRAADRALYEAKSAGRNCTCFEDQEVMQVHR